MIINLLLLLPLSQALADPPMSNLYGADIVVNGKARSGYLGVFEMEPVDFKTPDVLTQLKRYKKIGFVQNVVELRHLSKKEAHVRFGQLVSTSAAMQFIDTASISKLTRVERPFDGAPYYARIAFVPERRAKLLSTKEPTFVCTATYSESPTLYWVSYSPKIGQDVLAPICNSIEPPSGKTARAILRNENVFNVTFASD